MAYLRSIESFVTAKFIPTLAQYSTVGVSPETQKPRRFSMVNIFGNARKAELLSMISTPGLALPPVSGRAIQICCLVTFRENLVAGKKLGRFDSRMTLASKSPYEPDKYIDVAFVNQMNDHLPNFVNYKGASAYAVMPSQPINNWVWSHQRLARFVQSSEHG